MQFATFSLTDLLARLPSRPSAAHKGDFGHVLIVGGAPGMLGAVILAAGAAARAGAGLVTVATHSQHAALVSVAQPTVMSYGVTGVTELRRLLARATVVIVGPGLGQSEWSKRLLTTVLASHAPLVIDADALNIIATMASSRLTRAIITPHPGEAARLINSTPDIVQSDRPAAVCALAERYDSVVVLKGAGTLVYAHGELPMYCQLGNPSMASAGMGDVLSGILGGLIAQHLSLYDAACLGVMLHAHAGDTLARARGARVVLASDVMNFFIPA